VRDIETGISTMSTKVSRSKANAELAVREISSTLQR
jgi:hypothetical protein